MWELHRYQEEDPTPSIDGQSSQKSGSSAGCLRALLPLALVGATVAMGFGWAAPSWSGGALFLCVAAGILSLGLAAVSRTRITVGPHRIRIERVGRWGRTPVVDVLWDDVADIQRVHRDLGFFDHDGHRIVASDLGASSEVRWIHEHLMAHLRARLEAQPVSEDDAQVDDALRAVQALTRAVDR